MYWDTPPWGFALSLAVALPDRHPHPPEVGVDTSRKSVLLTGANPSGVSITVARDHPGKLPLVQELVPIQQGTATVASTTLTTVGDWRRTHIARVGETCCAIAERQSVRIELVEYRRQRGVAAVAGQHRTAPTQHTDRRVGLQLVQGREHRLDVGLMVELQKRQVVVCRGLHPSWVDHDLLDAEQLTTLRSVVGTDPQLQLVSRHRVVRFRHAVGGSQYPILVNQCSAASKRFDGPVAEVVRTPQRGHWRKLHGLMTADDGGRRAGEGNQCHRRHG